MLAKTLLFITLIGLIAPTLAFVECYPKANCQVIEPRYYQVPVSEEHEGFNGQFTFFRSTAYCRSGKNTWKGHTTMCTEILANGNCGNCLGVDPGQCINSPGDGVKFICAFSGSAE